MRHNCFYQPILVALMTLWSFAAHSQIVINYQAPDSTQVTYEDSQFDIFCPPEGGTVVSIQWKKQLESSGN